MGETMFTTEQETAISLRDKNLLVSASAGTGKTTVLVERIIRMATDEDNPVDLDRMLIVTFTNAASDEMKNRIRSAIYKEIRKNPSNERLRRQLILLNQASISTIHSFCSEVIRSNYHLLDIDPGFNVCDENDADKYLKDAIELILSDAYEKNSDSFEKLINSYGRGKDDGRFIDLVIGIYKKIRSIPAYREWLANAAELFLEKRDDFAGSRWGNLIINYSASRIAGYISDISELKEVIEGVETLAGYVESLEKDRILLEKIHKALLSKNWDEASLVILRLKFEKLNNAKRGAPSDLKQLVKGSRDDYKKEIEKVKERLQGTSEQIYSNMLELAPQMMEISRLLNLIDREYSLKKRNEGVLDYSDLEHYALECLKAEAGSIYRDRFDEIFVDEYQDSNQLQENIVNLVSGRGNNENNVFMVGDIKQSIYKFRQAEPGIFKEKYNRFSSDISKSNIKVELFINYRSRLPILDFTNYIFSGIMSEDVGDIVYDEKVLLKQGAEFKPGNDNGYPVEIMIVNGDDEALFTRDIKPDAKEAAVVGHKILEIIESGMLIKDKKSNKERKVNFGDITVLNRSANSVSSEYMKQLKRMGIPVNSDSNSDFFNNRAIIVIRSFLEVLDNPRRDISLLALLRSGIFGFSDKELALIRCGSRNSKFYDSLINFDSNTKLKKKIVCFLEVISAYRKDSYKKPMDKLVWSIMQDTGLYNSCEKGGNALIRQQNLRRFFEIAGKYESTSNEGLFGFIKYIERLRDSKSITGDNSVGADNTVKFMSIHKSKGLEFPVVILSGCGKAFNKSDLTQNLIFDRQLGFGPDYINHDAGYKLIPAVKKSIKIKKAIEGLAEEMRVLYVALTRAREKLVITGYTKNIETTLNRWQLRGRRKGNEIDPGKVMTATGFFDWIIPVIIKHKNCANIHDVGLIDEEDLDSGTPDFNIDIVYPETVYKYMNLSSKVPDGPVFGINLNYPEVKERFEWKYPYAEESIFHKKVSVTEIKKLRDVQNGEKDIFGTKFVPHPEFMSEGQSYDAAARGTMLHNVIAAVNPKRALVKGYIYELFKKAGAGIADIKDFSQLVLDFFMSDIGKRMSASLKSESEKPFLLRVPTKQLYPDDSSLLDSGHTTLVQGVIDSIFYEKDGAVIVDYKSDNVLPGNEEKHAQKYKTQLDLYERAVEELTNIPVKGKYIYFFTVRKSVKIL